MKWRGNAVAGIAVAAPSGTITSATQNQVTTPKEYLNIDRVAEYCGVSTKMLRRAVRSRRLAFFSPGRAYMFLAQDLDAFMNAARFGAVVFGKAA